MKTVENRLEKLRILYVEDDASIRALIEKKLRRVAAEVLVAENGKLGLESYLQHAPDLVVSDVKIPEMDGLDMAAAIKVHNRDTPVILTTASNDTDDLLRAISISIDGYVLKPIHIDFLQDTLHRCASSLFYKRELERKNHELQKLHDSERDDLAVAHTIMSNIMCKDGLNDPKIRYFQRPARHFSGDIIAAG